MTEVPQSNPEQPPIPEEAQLNTNNPEASTQGKDSLINKLSLSGLRKALAKRKLSHIDDTIDFLEGHKPDTEKAAREEADATTGTQTVTPGARRKIDRVRYKNSRKARVADNLMTTYGERPKDSSTKVTLIRKGTEYGKLRKTMSSRNGKVSKLIEKNRGDREAWTESLLKQKRKLESEHNITGRPYSKEEADTRAAQGVTENNTPLEKVPKPDSSSEAPRRVLIPKSEQDYLAANRFIEDKITQQGSDSQTEINITQAELMSTLGVKEEEAENILRKLKINGKLGVKNNVIRKSDSDNNHPTIDTTNTDTPDNIEPSDQIEEQQGSDTQSSPSNNPQTESQMPVTTARSTERSYTRDSEATTNTPETNDDMIQEMIEIDGIHVSVQDIYSDIEESSADTDDPRVARAIARSELYTALSQDDASRIKRVFFELDAQKRGAKENVGVFEPIMSKESFDHIRSSINEISSRILTQRQSKQEDVSDQDREDAIDQARKTAANKVAKQLLSIDSPDEVRGFYEYRDKLLALYDKQEQERIEQAKAQANAEKAVADNAAGTAIES